MACTNFLKLGGLSLLIAAAAHGFKQLDPIQQLANRNPYYGGYALPESNLGCPASTETCTGSFCCPMGTFCGPDSNGAYCCPTNEDCATQVNDLPTCADPSWTLFDDVYPWCCTEGQIGIGGQVCADPSVSYSTDDYAETETQANTAQPPATRSTVAVAGGAAATTTTGPAPAASTTKAVGLTATSAESTSFAASPTATKASDASSVKGSAALLMISFLIAGFVVGLM